MSVLAFILRFAWVVQTPLLGAVAVFSGGGHPVMILVAVALPVAAIALFLRPKSPVFIESQPLAFIVRISLSAVALVLLWDSGMFTLVAWYGALSVAALVVTARVAASATTEDGSSGARRS